MIQGSERSAKHRRDTDRICYTVESITIGDIRAERHECESRI